MKKEQVKKRKRRKGRVKMKGLLLKDLYMMRKYCRSYLVIVGVFTIMAVVLPFVEDGNRSTLFLSAYPVLLAGILPVTLISYEEKSKWNQYVGIFPYTKREQVSVKYLDMLAVLSIGLSLAAISQGVTLAATASFHWETYILLLEGILFTGLLSPCILLPVVFWFGVEKGRIVYFAVLILFFGGIGISKILIQEETVLWLFQRGSSGTLLALAVFGLLILSLSWRLSIWLYEKKEC